MKTINCTFTDEEFKALKMAKNGKYSWETFILRYCLGIAKYKELRKNET